MNHQRHLSHRSNMSAITRRSVWTLPLLAMLSLPAGGPAGRHLPRRHAPSPPAFPAPWRTSATSPTTPSKGARSAPPARAAPPSTSPGASAPWACSPEDPTARSSSPSPSARARSSARPTGSQSPTGRTPRARTGCPSASRRAATVDAPLAYWGTGLSQPGDPDDRFSHMEVAGKVLVVEWGDPDGSQRHGACAVIPTSRRRSPPARGAAGLLVLLPEGMDLPSPDAEIRNALAIPVAAVAAPRPPALRQAAEAGAPAASADRRAPHHAPRPATSWPCFPGPIPP